MAQLICGANTSFSDCTEDRYGGIDRDARDEEYFDSSTTVSARSVSISSEAGWMSNDLLADRTTGRP